MSFLDVSRKIKTSSKERIELSRFYNLAKPVYEAIKDRNFNYSIIFDSVMRERNPMYIENIGARLISFNYKIHVNPYLKESGDDVIKGLFAHEFSHTLYSFKFLDNSELEAAVHMHAISKGFANSLMNVNDYLQFRFKDESGSENYHSTFTNEQIEVLMSKLKDKNIGDIICAAKKHYSQLDQQIKY